LLIAAGVLRALQTPTAPILGGAHGKARAPAWLGHGLRFALLAAGIMLGGTWLQIPFRWLARPMTEAPAASELDAVQVAQRIPETGALRADLPGGGRVELLAVGEPGAVPNGWWTPDGTPVRGATYAVSNSAALFAPAGRPWDLVLRITDLPENTPLVTFDIGTAFNTGGGGEVFQDGRPLAGGRHLRVAWPADARREGFRIGFGGPDWKLVSTHFPPGPSASWNRERGLPDLGYVLTDLVDTEEGARAVFAAGKADHRWRTRLFAIDNEGAEHAPISTRGVGTATSHQVILVFGGIKAAAIRQIRVLAQPFHWVAFQGVALVPNRPVPPPQPLRFDREWEVTFEDLLDLDTGRTGAFPGGRAGTVDVARGAGSFAGLDQDLAWMQEQGFDLEARAGSVGALGLRAVVLDLRDWEGLTPEELGYRLRESGGMPTELKALGPLPAVFGFRTREGALGLLMISDYAGDRPGVTVKAKRVP
jgi:hypothetical protein